VGAIAAGTVGEGVEEEGAGNAAKGAAPETTEDAEASTEEEGAGNAAKKAKKSKGAMCQLSL